MLGLPASQQVTDPLYRHIPRHRCVRLQLGSPERLPSEQYCWAMEAGYRGGFCDGL